MKLNVALLRIFWRQALPATATGALSLGFSALVSRDVMTARDHLPPIFVFLQCLLLGLVLGSSRSPAFAFIHSRGYSRGRLWAHVMLASGLSVIAAWLPATLIIWTGLRSYLHDRLLRNPNFPVMAPRETWVPLVWLGLFLLLVPAFHYVWIRRAQPTKGQDSGWFVIVAIVAALLVAFSLVYYLNGWFAWLSALLYIVVVVSLTWGSRALYRSLEVRS